MDHQRRLHSFLLSKWKLSSSIFSVRFFALFWLLALLTWIAKWGKSMRPCVLSVTAMLNLMKCMPMFGTVTFLFTIKVSTKVSLPISNLNMIVVVGLPYRPFATCFWKFGGSTFLKILFRVCCSILFYSISIFGISTVVIKLLSHLLLGEIQIPDTHTTLPLSVWALKCRKVEYRVHYYFHLSQAISQCMGIKLWKEDFYYLHLKWLSCEF